VVTGKNALSGGLVWGNGGARLHLSNDAAQDAGPGSRVAVRVTGPRRCVGWWSRGDGHHDCPFDQAIAATSVDAQCGPCARADSGRRLARGDISGDDRPFRLYLAWFGGRTVKVGITAEARGDARLRDQGALVYSFIAAGPLPAVRGAEMAISASKNAVERVRADRKIAHWWDFDATDAPELLRATARRVTTGVSVPDGLQWLDVDPVDLTALFGLDGDLPDSYRPLAALTDGGALVGDVLVAAGHALLLSTAEATVLCDTRRLTGWPLAETDGAQRGLTLGAVNCPDRPGDVPTLF
jgi:hypothetical protein